MAISTETILLRVEGQTDGAVRATEKLVEAQKKLGQAASGAGQALQQATVPATSMFGKIGEGLKSAGVDVKTFSGGLRDIGKGMTFDLIRTGLKSLNTDLNSTAESALSAGVSGASMGAAFGGPLGAAIGGAAGALVGLVRHTDEQTGASKRAAAAAREHAAALKLVAEGETKARGARRDARQDFELAQKENSAASAKVAEQIKKFGAASEGAYADKLRAKRALEDAEDLRESLNKAGGNIWLEERKQYRERERAIEDITAARKKAYITDEEAEKRLAALNKVEEKATEVAKKRVEVTYANVQAALAARGVTQRTDTAGPTIGFSASLGSIADTNVYNEYGTLQDEQGLLDRIEVDRRKNQFNEGLGAIGAAAGADAKRKNLLESSFGKIDEINAYKTAFDGLSGAVTAGMDAWISGSESAGIAIKKFVGSYLAGLASQMAIEALKYEAYAIASLVPGPFFNPAAAAGYATTGALFAAGAVAAGVAAAAAGGGGGVAPKGGGGASGGTGGGGRPDGGSVNSPGMGDTRERSNKTVVIFGDPFAEGSPRMRREQAARAIRRAGGGTGWSDE